MYLELRHFRTLRAIQQAGGLAKAADLLNTTFNDNLLAIARAGAGVNNIPLDRCSEQGIVVFNTPGANANADNRAVAQTGRLCAHH